MRVEVDVTVEDLEGDYSMVEGVVARCTRCDNESESFGISDASIRRCLVLLREGCPLGEHNFYVDADEI